MTVAISLISSRDTDEQRVVHPKNDNIESMIYDKADEVTQKRFESFFIDINLLLNSSNLIFDCYFVVLQM